MLSGCIILLIILPIILRSFSGKPKGFCFVTYKDKESAVLAIDRLDKFSLRNRHLIVRIANAPRHIANTNSSSSTSRRSQISALEAKLKSMEAEKTDVIKAKQIPRSLVMKAAHSQSQQHKTKPYDRSSQ